MKQIKKFHWTGGGPINRDLHYFPTSRVQRSEVRIPGVKGSSAFLWVLSISSLRGVGSTSRRQEIDNKKLFLVSLCLGGKKNLEDPVNPV